MAELILDHRRENGLSQEKLARLLKVTGSAIFRFEEGSRSPTFQLWRRMAEVFGLSEGQSVLIWIQDRVPEEWGEKLTLSRGKRLIDLPVTENREELRRAVLDRQELPRGLRHLVRDDAIWMGQKPTSQELRLLWEFLGGLGEGSKDKYRRALRVLRGFTGSGF